MLACDNARSAQKALGKQPQPQQLMAERHVETQRGIF